MNAEDKKKLQELVNTALEEKLKDQGGDVFETPDTDHVTDLIEYTGPVQDFFEAQVSSESDDMVYEHSQHNERDPSSAQINDMIDTVSDAVEAEVRAAVRNWRLTTKHH